MKILETLPPEGTEHAPLTLTIGNFDGVHLGHTALLARVREIAEQKKLKSAVITFTNHPSSVLTPGNVTPLLCTVEHKLHLLEEAEIDLCIALPFTKALSIQSAETFLAHVQKALSLHTLVLGSDAHIGKNREGDRTVITTIAAAKGFALEYFPDYLYEGKRISSSRIRGLIQEGNLQEVKQLLGRAYSVHAPVIPGSNQGKKLGFPTANLALEGLCLPPLGVYLVKVQHAKKELWGVANLGVAPTMRDAGKPLLEVHLFDANIDLYSHPIEVIFCDYLRPEKQFDSIDALKAQIARDITHARQILALKPLSH